MKPIRAFIAVFTIPIFLSLAAFAARAQGSRHDGMALGEQGRPVGGASIAVCAQPANVTIVPCTPLANLYTDTTLTTPAPNPLASDGLGNFHFYAAPGLYTVQIYGPGINTYTTPDVILPLNPLNAQFGSLTATNSISALTLNLGGNLSVGGNATITGTLTAGSFNPVLSPSSNAELKPFSGDAILWVSPSGSDANDGKSPGTAMATVAHAACSLPGGNCSTNIAGSGTIYFFNNSAANATGGCGFWIMGAGDPNFSSPPPCWLKSPSGSSGIALIGIPQQVYGPNGQRPSALLAGGSTADRNHPLIWLSDTNGAYEFDNIAGAYSFQRGVVIGECSNNTRTGTCNVSGAHFFNDWISPSLVAGYGPAWDITGGSFWIGIRDSGGQGTDTVNTPTGDLAPAMLVDGRTNGGVGLLTINGFDTSDGGIKIYPGSGLGADVNISNVTSESISGAGEATVWFAAPASGCTSCIINASLKDIQTADATTTVPGVQNDLGSGPSIHAEHIYGQIINTKGPMVITDQDAIMLQNQTATPLAKGQTGFVNGWVYGKRDDVQRAAGLTPVRFPNVVAGSNCAQWNGTTGWTATNFGGGTAFSCGNADTFGGTGAAKASTTSASDQESIRFNYGSVENVSVSVGETFIGGVWTRSVTANGYSGNPYTPAFILVQGTGFAATGGCDGDSVGGDGEWTWNRCLYTVTSVGSGDAALVFGVTFDSTHTVEAFAPVWNLIPAGSLSPSELAAYENSLKSYDAACAVATVCGLQSAILEGPAFESMSANPAQSGAFRLADADAIAWRNHANTGDVTLAKNSGDQLVAPPFASPTFFSPIVDSASGASGITFRNSGSTVWTANASSSALDFNFNAHLGETALKLAPFGGQSYAGLVENYGMAAGFISVTESSGTASFDAGLGNTFELTLNANVTSTTLSNAQPGQWLNFIICQPASGGPFTFAWPSNVRGGMTIGTTAGKCSAQSFAFDGSSAFATSVGSANQ